MKVGDTKCSLEEIDRALRFMSACGIDLHAELQLQEVDFYTSHEALILGYEEALTRKDSITDDWYDCSAHLLWIGERTRQLDGAHIEFLSGVENPIGIKLGPSVTPEDAVAICERLNPTRRAGRIMLVSRMGASNIADALPPLLDAVDAPDIPSSGRVIPCTATRINMRRVTRPATSPKSCVNFADSSPRVKQRTYGRVVSTSS